MRQPGTNGRAWWPALLLLVGLAGVGVVSVRADEEGSPWLGVMMQDLTNDLRDGMSYRGEGVLLSRVIEGSPAEKAGLRKGDIVVSLNGRTVRDPEALTEIVQGAETGQSVAVVVMRNGARRTFTARLAARPDDVEWEEEAPEARAPRSSRAPDVPRLRGLERLKDLEALKELKHLEGLKDHGDFKVFEFDGHGPGDIVISGMGRGRMGVRVENLGSDLAEYFDAAPGSGALVIEVLKDSPAARAGLKAGDVITRVGDQSVSDAENLVQAVRKAADGTVTVSILRKGAARTFEVELEKAPTSWRKRDGGQDMVLGPHRRSFNFRRGDGGDGGVMEDELRQLRRELGELREKLEKLDDR